MVWLEARWPRGYMGTQSCDSGRGAGPSNGCTSDRSPATAPRPGLECGRKAWVCVVGAGEGRSRARGQTRGAERRRELDPQTRGDRGAEGGERLGTEADVTESPDRLSSTRDEGPASANSQNEKPPPHAHSRNAPREKSKREEGNGNPKTALRGITWTRL